MNAATLITLLQLVTSLLMGVKDNPAASQATKQAALTKANQAIQQAIQFEATPSFPFTVPQNDSLWPSITDLRNAPYLDANGNYVPLGTGVGLVEEDTSFGDINADGVDDAAVIVTRITAPGQSEFALAAMLNQGGIMFNIADLSLGPDITIFSHHVIEGGGIQLNMQVGNGPATTSTYYLVADQLIKA